jgi:hypothetical protein
MGPRRDFRHKPASAMQEKDQKKKHLAKCWWFMSLILATWEAEIGRILVLGQPGQLS